MCETVNCHWSYVALISERLSLALQAGRGSSKMRYGMNHRLTSSSSLVLDGPGITKIKRTRCQYIHFQHLIEVENADKARTNVRV